MTASGARPRSMRSKEDAHDYRYFPDPDLLPLVLDEAWVDGLRSRAAGIARRPSGLGSCRNTGCRRTMPGFWSPSRPLRRSSSPSPAGGTPRRRPTG